MGLTSSLYAGLSGLKSNEFRMDVIGDNIANVNTYGFKSSSVNFQNQFLSTFSFGSAAEGTHGGTNPMQVGTGSAVGAVSRNFSGGAPETTGKNTDLAVQGEGLFTLERADGALVYTRDGSFQLNSENYLTSADGFYVQGYAVDQTFNIVQGALDRLRIPLGEIATATVTSEVSFAGDLDGSAALPTSRPVTTSVPLITAPATPAIGTTPLTSLVNGASDQKFYTDNVITLYSAVKGGATLPEREFIVGTTGTTVNDLLAWLDNVLGITTLSDEPNLLDLTAGGAADQYQDPEIKIDAAGQIVIISNVGSENQILLPSGSIRATIGNGATAPADSVPFSFTSIHNATADQLRGSTRTSFQAYDSLGVPLDVVVTMTVESKDDSSGTTWRFFVESDDDTDVNRSLGTGTITFDPAGHYSAGTGLSVQVDREDTGAQSPQTITLDFSDMKGYEMASAISLLSQDGFPSGTLQDFSIGSDGIILGAFTNGQTKSLGQVIISTFRNYEGLIADGQNLYLAGPNSGDPIVKEPQQLGAGTINSGALELSNVDLSREFINLIVASTGFSASSRVIQTSDQLIDELIMLTR